jgi:predicted RNase H-like HicB family nuclease
MKDRIRKIKHGLDIVVEVLLVKEGDYWVSYAPSLKLSSYGDSKEEAKKGFAEALRIFIDDTSRKGTLERLLIDYGWTLSRNNYQPPPGFGTVDVTNLLQAANGKPSVYTRKVPIPA